MKNHKNEKKENRPVVQNSIISCGLFLWFTCAVPLYFNDGYFDMLQAKGRAYDVGGAIAILGAIILIARWVINKSNKRNLDDMVAPIPRKCLLDWSIVALAIVAVLSSICSGNVGASWWGMNGWCIGGFALLSFAVIYLILSNGEEPRANLWLPVLLVNSIIFIIGILHSAGIDVLGLHAGIKEDQFYWYISTIGNLNWLVGYLSLLLPMLAVFYTESTDRTSRVIYLMSIFLAATNLFLCASDGIYLAIGVCGFFAIPYFLSTTKRAEGLGKLIITFALAELTVALLPIFRAKRTTYDGISEIFIQPLTGVIILLVGAVVLITLGRDGFDKKDKAKRACAIFLEFALAGVAAVFFVKALSSYGSGWGSDRSVTWTYSLNMYKEFGVKNKLIGVGPEMLGAYYGGLAEYFEQNILAAHSVPIQLLLTTGILGLICWLCIWGSVIYRFIKRRIWTGKTMAYFLPLVAYLGQSLVNSDQATNVGLLCIVLSLFSISFRKEYTK